jgi:hypothetical protein
MQKNAECSLVTYGSCASSTQPTGERMYQQHRFSDEKLTIGEINQVTQQFRTPSENFSN